MSGLYLEIRGMPRRIGYWVTTQVRRVRRLTAVPIALRAGAGLAASGALLLALPLDTAASAPPAAVVLGLAGAAVALWPRSSWVSVVAVATVGFWLLASTVTGEPVRLWRLGLLAAALYLMHSCAALAAVLPADAVVSREVLRDWAGRTGAVLGASVLLSLAGIAVLSGLPRARTMAGPIIGSIIAAGLVGLLVWRLYRHPNRS